jgi:glycosyltransferase involved in cell wall biosynthesis
MRIGIHALWSDRDPLGGLATYLATLIENLGRVDAENDYTVYYTHSSAIRSSDYLPSRFQKRILWPASRWFGLPVGLPLELMRRPVDLLNVLAVAPPICPVPFVQTLHDVDYLLNPGFYPSSIRFRLSVLVPYTARRAVRITTTSEFSKKCIVDYYGIPEEKVTVTYHGVSPIFRKIDDPEGVARFRAKHKLPERYLLYVGKIQARKNISRLLEAFHILKRERGLPHKLVIVGKRTFASAEIMQTLEKLDLQDDVVFTGEQTADELLYFYNLADLFVFPSLSEGFGIPPLEAMACGTPVVASSATSIPEVVGDAGVLVDPFDVRKLAAAIFDVATVESLREDLVARGFKRVGLFSNRRLAEQVVKVYTDAYRESGGLIKTTAH